MLSFVFSAIFSLSVFRIGDLKPRQAGVRVKDCFQGGILESEGKLTIGGKMRNEMKKKFLRLLFWLGIFGLVFLGGITGSIGKVKAAQPLTGPTIYTPRFSSPDPNSTYFENQKMTIFLNYGQVGLKVTANLQVIDKGMPSNMPVIDNATGTYTLITPALSGETMVIGEQIAIPFVAVATDGEMATINSTYLINVRTYPLKGGATISPAARVSALAEDSQVHLWWTPIEGASEILVRYVDPQGNPRQILVPQGNDGVIIRNLENDFNYQFMIAGRDESGTVGTIKTIAAMPMAPLATTSPKEVAGEATSEEIAPATSGGQSIAKAPAETPAVTEQPKEEQVAQTLKTEEKSTPAEARNWNRLLLAISILIIAAGAAVGGYYGYEWYLARKEEPLKHNEPRSKNRW